MPLVVVLLWLFIGGPLGSFAGKLTSVQENDNAAFLPKEVESTLALNEFTKFSGNETLPATLVFERQSGLTAADNKAIAGLAADVRTVENIDVKGIVGPVPSEDGRAAQVVVPILGSDGEEVTSTVADLRAVLDRAPPGLTALVGGQGGFLGDFIVAFGAIDGLLLGVALLVVLIILLVVYRTPVLPIVVLVAALLGLGVASAVIYALATNDVLDVNGQSQGILFILAVGAATDYSLLLVARYREELRDHESPYDAMRNAFRGAAPAIVASGATVILGLLCLLLSNLSSLSGLGPVGAIGIAAAVLSSLTLLPAALLLLGRKSFWPLQPAFGSQHTDSSSVWGRIARLVGRRPRVLWVSTFIGLAACAAFVPTLNEEPAPQTEIFLTQVDSADAQVILDDHFASDQANPAFVVVPASSLVEAARVAQADPGVAANGVLPLPDVPATGGQPGGGQPGGGQPGGAPPAPKVIDGESILLVTLKDPADSEAATETVRRLRGELDNVSLDVQVGGATATLVDTRTTVDEDRAKVIPAILAVVFVVLALLLRSLLAPLLLLVANVLSFGATLGISAVLFNHVFDFPTTDPSISLIGFVFLVALGIDYSIFLMTRAREESLIQGTHPGILKALSVTGGVITSAGIVLSATFAALGVLPILFLAQIAFIVAFGVLLDALLVRTLLVPALAYDLGPLVWWPSRLWHTPDHADAGTQQMLHMGQRDGVSVRDGG